MELGGFINVFIGGIIISLTNFYIWSKLLEKQIDFKAFKTYILILSLTIVMTLNNYYMSNFFKIICMTLIMMIFCRLLFKEKLNRIVVTPIVSQFVIMISELIFLFLSFIVFGTNTNEKLEDYMGTLVINLPVAFFALILMKFNFSYKLYNFLIKITSKINKYELVIFSIILIVSVNVLEVSIYNKISMMWLALINTGLIIIYSIIIFQMANTKNEYLTISEKYNRSKNSLTEYQSVVSRYRIDNHENKSQLKRLRNKIDKENKEAIEYIDMILDTRIKNNEKILNKTKIIPDSDLKVLIDSKIMTMEEKNINNKLHVDKEVKTIDLIEIDQLLMEDICKIVGVYLDNAIEAVETLDKKEIQLDLYKLDDFLCISVVNNYEGEIELDKLYDVGYTTKDNGHGYGLPLVAEIVDNNKNLSKETHVNEEIFRQVLKIKM